MNINTKCKQRKLCEQRVALHQNVLTTNHTVPVHRPIIIGIMQIFKIIIKPNI